MPGPPFSPWLRLAHHYPIGPGHEGRRAGLRRLRDFEFFLQLAGDTWFHLPVAGGCVPLLAGHLAFIPPGLVHAWGYRTGVHVAVHADLHAQVALESMAMIERIDGTVGPGPELPGWTWRLRLGGEDFVLPLVMAVDAAAWWRRFQPLVEQWTQHGHRSAAARLQAAEILGQAFGDVLARGRRGGDDRLAAILAEAAGGPPQTAHIPALAARAGLGETAFRAAVRARFGRSPRAHLERLRLDRAAYALTTTALPVAEIAAAAGYADPFHFARVFRRVHGRSPSAYRHRHGP